MFWLTLWNCFLGCTKIWPSTEICQTETERERRSCQRQFDGKACWFLGQNCHYSRPQSKNWSGWSASLHCTEYDISRTCHTIQHWQVCWIDKDVQKYMKCKSNRNCILSLQQIDKAEIHFTCAIFTQNARAC